ncbi:DUF2062 domain-containing protein, partial [Vibrio parahaemolyticus]|nr:DUF2062 domain-containing protein [Vibrio parahaemolyticus]
MTRLRSLQITPRSNFFLRESCCPMPRKLIKRFMPDHELIKRQK